MTPALPKVNNQRIAIVVDHDVATAQRCTDVLTAEGFKIFLESQTTSLQAVGPSQDEVVICAGQTVVQDLDAIPYRQRTIVTGVAQRKDWAPQVLGRPATLWIALDHPQQTARFWAPATDVPDANKDGVISWQERYAGAVGKAAQKSAVLFLPTEGYVQAGTAPFAKSVAEIKTTPELKSQLQHLLPGQYAIVTFGATWCDWTERFLPELDQMAQGAHGQFLFLKTLNEDVARAHGIGSYPTVLVMDRYERGYDIDPDRRKHALRLLPEALLDEPPAEECHRLLDMAQNANDAQTRSDLVHHVINLMKKSPLRGDAAPVFERLVHVAQAEPDPEDKESLLFDVLMIATRENGYPLLHRVSQWVTQLSDGEDQVNAYTKLANAQIDHGQKKSAVTLIKTAAQKLELLPRPRQYRHWLALANAALNFSDHKTALLYFERALDATAHSEIPDSNLLGCLNEFQVEQFGKASVRVLERATQLAETIEKIETRVKVLQEIAFGYSSIKMQAPARQQFQAILALIPQLPPKEGTQSDAYAETAHHMYIAGFEAEAVAVYHQAAQSLQREAPAVQAQKLYDIAYRMQNHGIGTEHYYQYLIDADYFARQEGQPDVDPADQVILLNQISDRFKADGLVSEAASSLLNAIPVVRRISDTDRRQRIEDMVKESLEELGLAYDAR